MFFWIFYSCELRNHFIQSRTLYKSEKKAEQSSRYIVFERLFTRVEQLEVVRYIIRRPSVIYRSALQQSDRSYRPIKIVFDS